MKKYGPAGFAILALVILLSLNFGESGLQARGGSSVFAPGDTDCNGVVDAVDALLLLRDSSQLSAEGRCAATVDNDCSGALDAVDALRVLRHSAGMAVDYRRGCPLIGGNDAPAP